MMSRRFLFGFVSPKCPNWAVSQFEFQARVTN
jgi:hypothetical protein